MNFRKLKANEIDCRIAMVKDTGISLLLYKDARVDQNILDETVGALNWQRSHSRDNANCTVSIWDESKSQWVSKEDTGKESYTEAEKGLASDSFKRACFNWGIGRELYSAPFIWITPDKINLNSGKCYDKFIVDSIAYDDEGNISDLVIKNQSRKNEVVFTLNNGITEGTLKKIFKEMDRTGVTEEVICKRYKIDSLNVTSESVGLSVLKSLKASKDKQ